MEFELKTTAVDIESSGDVFETKLPDRKMFLQLPDERPLLRRSTSPSIKLPGEDDCKISPARSTSVLPSPDLSHTPSLKKLSGSRKNSIVSFFFPNKSPQMSPEEQKHGEHRKFLSPAGFNDSSSVPKSKGKLLKKTASVVQLYNSVLHSLRTISKTNEDIMPELTKSFFEKVLRDSEKNDELQVTKVKVSNGKEFGSHFCSEVHSLEVSAKTKKSPKEYLDTFQLIIKSQPLSEDARQFLKPNRTFEKEVQMYSLVFKEMANYVKKQSFILYANHESEVLSIPKCYFSRCGGEGQTKEDMIIMENLLQKGFSFIEHSDMTMNKVHVEMAIREIAKFHAITYCMKDGSDKVLLEKYSTLCKDSLYTKDTYEYTKRTMTPIMASLAELIRSTSKYSDNYEWFVELAKNFHWIQTKMVESTDKFGVICHGDLWWSNILFRYQNEDNIDSSGLPIEVKFIDFQSARLASLVTDILSFAFTSMSSSVRRENIYELLEVGK